MNVSCKFIYYYFVFNCLVPFMVLLYIFIIIRSEVSRLVLYCYGIVVMYFTYLVWPTV